MATSLPFVGSGQIHIRRKSVHTTKRVSPMERLGPMSSCPSLSIPIAPLPSTTMDSFASSFLAQAHARSCQRAEFGPTSEGRSKEEQMTNSDTSEPTGAEIEATTEPTDEQEQPVGDAVN